MTLGRLEVGWAAVSAALRTGLISLAVAYGLLNDNDYSLIEKYDDA